MSTGAPALTIADIESMLSRVDPSVVLVPPRILRRVIKRDRGLSGPGLQVPHHKSYVIAREALLALASRAELGLDPGRDLPDTLVLLPRPDDQRLARRPTDAILLKGWRLLFHAQVHVAFARLRAEGRFTAEVVRECVRRLGRVVFAEAGAVLRQENFVLPPGDEATVLVEFAAVFLELRRFDPGLLARYFPAVEDYDAVESVLAADLDPDALLAGTRPEGAPDLAAPLAAPAPAEPAGPSAAQPDAAAHARLVAEADRAAGRGNRVRAAILRQRALEVAPPAQAAATRTAARRGVERMAARLQKALGFSAREADTWRRCLQGLLLPATGGWWNVEARLLYDLQSVCLDQERFVYAADLVEWFVSWFNRPIKRLLPDQPQVLTVKHLRSARHRVGGVRLPDELRQQLTDLLARALHHAEEKLRAQLRPKVKCALDEVALTPRNYVERLARDQLVEELLDRVVERGFLTLGDLRDALARNRLKLPDLSSPVEFVLGDPLIRANRQLACDADGVYRRGEIYLRWLQRLSSLAFGNPVGRFLTRYLILPFGGSAAALYATDEMFELSHKYLGTPHVQLLDPYSFVGLGAFLFALLHSALFRRWVGVGLGFLWGGARAVCYELPAAALRLPLVRGVLQSRAYFFLYQFALKPLLLAAPVPATLHLAGAGPPASLGVGAGAFLAVSAFLNSRLGLYVEEWWTDGVIRTWHLFSRNLLPGLFNWVMYVSRTAVGEVERLLYAVDEWLRFRSGQGRLTFVAKLVLGLLWFFVTYVARIWVNLLLEPQVNPIKHFPAVTVAAKLLVPALPYLFPIFTTPLEPLFGRAAARLVATVVLGFLPGLAGFLVWELKENWRLYRANQPAALEPVVVGGHGERVIELLRPGFHSGTLPKLYARLRRSDARSARKAREGLHHVEEGLHHFAERSLLALLAGTPGWGSSASLVVGTVGLATNRVRLELCCPGLGAESVLLDFENRGGRLVAGLTRPGWLTRLAPEPARTFRDALVGFYKLAGVDLVREQVEALLPAGSDWDVTDEGLVVWPGDGRTLLYDPEAPEAPPRLLAGPEGLPALPVTQVLFRRLPVRWDEWVQRWEPGDPRGGAQAGKVDEGTLLPGMPLLPEGVARVGAGPEA